jgi:hypothetical protein
MYMQQAFFKFGSLLLLTLGVLLCLNMLAIRTNASLDLQSHGHETEVEYDQTDASAESDKTAEASETIKETIEGQYQTSEVIYPVIKNALLLNSFSYIDSYSFLFHSSPFRPPCRV